MPPESSKYLHCGGGGPNFQQTSLQSEEFGSSVVSLAQNTQLARKRDTLALFSNPSLSFKTADDQKAGVGRWRGWGEVAKGCWGGRRRGGDGGRGEFVAKRLGYYRPHVVVFA